MARTIVADASKLFACCLMAAVGLGLSPSSAAGGPDTEMAKPKREARAPKAEAPKSETPKAEAPKAEALKPTEATTAKADAPKPDAAAPDTDKAELGKPVAAKAEPAKVDTAADEIQSPETQAGVRKYCVNIAAAATDARFAWQSKKLLELETRIKARVAELDAKQADLKAWLDRRDLVAKEARESLVGIYSKMKPETAAAQISALDDDMATAVLAALSPGKASAIFNEITPTDRAAKLAGMLANPLAASNDKKL